MGTRIALHLERAATVTRDLEAAGGRLQRLALTVPVPRLPGGVPDLRPRDDPVARELRDTSTVLKQVAADLERRRRRLTGDEDGARSPVIGRGLFGRPSRSSLAATAIQKIFPNSPITALLKKAKAYRAVAAKAKKGVFWGNYCGAGTNPKNIDFDEEPGKDALDKCCRAHDLDYDGKNVDADSQFTAKSIWKVRNVNKKMAKCAAAARDDVANERDPGPGNTGVKGADAAEGVVGLFGGMAVLGATIETAIDAVDMIPGIDRDAAKRYVFAAINEFVDAAGAGVDTLQDLT